MRTVFNHLFSRISYKLAVLLILFTVLPLMSTGCYFLILIQTRFIQDTQHQSQEIVKGYSETIAHMIEMPITMLRSYASIVETLFADEDRMHIALTQLTLDVPALESVCVFDAEGRVRACSAFCKAYHMQGDTSAKIMQMIQQKPYHSPLYVNDKGVPYIDIAVALHQDADRHGMLYASINMSRLWRVVDAIAVGKTGRAFLITNDGVCIAHRDKRRVLQAENFAREPYFAKMRSHVTGYDEYVNSREKKEKVIYFAQVPEIPWILAIEQNRDEVYYYHRLSIGYTIGALAVVVICSLVVSVRVAGWLSKPVQTLQKAMRQVGRRDYSVHVTPQSHDEIGQLVIAFNRMMRKLREADDAQQIVSFGLMAGGIAHKLKNAFVSIKTSIELLSRRKSEKHFIEKMQHSLEEDVSRIEEMLSRFSHLEPDAEERTEPVDCIAVLKTLHSSYHELCREQKVSLHMRFDNDPVFVRASHEELKELFRNIINNALEAMPQGGALTITAAVYSNEHALRKRPSVLKVVCKDTGQGMSTEQLKKVFTPFCSTKEQGMGIGLTFCKRVMKALHGHIEILSELHSGTSVILTFPVLQQEDLQ